MNMDRERYIFEEYIKKQVNKQVNDMLDKIRAEMMTNWNGCCPDFDCPEIEYITKNEMLNIIDKYRTESEEDE